MSVKIGLLRPIFVALLLGIPPVFAAEGGAWSVSKVTGDVWITSDMAQPASLKQDDNLQPGQTIQTGRNGRVLLVRGEESMWVSPNSVVGLQKPEDGLSTTIIQRAGSILLDVEKRTVKHFEVETPYLAAVVKGTQFSVTVGEKSTSVEVKRGQVEVSDFKTGQIAQILPGQSASVLSSGKPGLVLGGSGTFNPIEQGKPRSPPIQRVPVPKGGLTAPLRAQGGAAAKQAGAGGVIKPTGGRSASLVSTGHGALRISAPIGEVKLNFNRVTQGLAHGTVVPASAGRSQPASQDNTSIWSSGQSPSSTSTSASGGQDSSGASNGSTGSGPGASPATAAATGAAVGPAIISAGPDGPDGNGPPGPKHKKDPGPANVAGPPGKGPGGNGPPGQGGSGPGKGPDGNGPPGHGGGGPPGKK